MINWIGAYIVGLVVLGILLNRDEYFSHLKEIENTSGPSLIAITVLQLLVFICYIGFLPNKSSFFFLSVPHLIVDTATLWIHEAGHAAFSWCGEFLHILGGTIFQLAFPLLFAWIGYNHRFQKIFSIGIFWLGTSLIDVAEYVGDAQERALPLLGVGAEGHDWHNLLSIMGLLPYDDTIAALFFISGVAVCTVGMLGVYANWIKPSNPTVLKCEDLDFQPRENRVPELRE